MRQTGWRTAAASPADPSPRQKRGAASGFGTGIVNLSRRNQPRGCSNVALRACHAALAGRRKERAGRAADERPGHSRHISARPSVRYRLAHADRAVL